MESSQLRRHLIKIRRLLAEGQQLFRLAETHTTGRESRINRDLRLGAQFARSAKVDIEHFGRRNLHLIESRVEPEPARDERVCGIGTTDGDQSARRRDEAFVEVDRVRRQLHVLLQAEHVCVLDFCLLRLRFDCFLKIVIRVLPVPKIASGIEQSKVPGSIRRSIRWF